MNSITTLQAQVNTAQAALNQAKKALYEFKRDNTIPVDKAEIRKTQKMLKYRTSNGLTIHNLRLAGVKISCMHQRQALVPYGTDTVTGKPVYAEAPVPSFMRGTYKFLPRGGATYITVEDKNGESVTVASLCHTIDSFDYKLGVKLALEHFSQEEATSLLKNGIIKPAKKELFPIPNLKQEEPVAAH